MQLSRVNYFFIALSLVLSLCNEVYAQCKFHSESSVQSTVNLTIPLKVQNLTLGTEVPTGYIFYRDGYTPTNGEVIVVCTEAIPEVVNKQLTNTSLPLSDYNVAPFAGKVYETGVPGIGIAFDHPDYPFLAEGGEVFPYDEELYCGGWPTDCYVDPLVFYYSVVLLKTGPIHSGVINGADLPCAEQTMGTVDSRVTVVKTCFTGSLAITAETCEILQPDIAVNLGSHDISANLDSISDMPWVDFSIRLTNCPEFHGYGFYDSEYSQTQTDGFPNVISYNLTSMTSVINANKGIISIDDTLSDSASGVGIQIAAFIYDSYYNQSDYIPVSLGRWHGLYNEELSNLVINLAARYVFTKGEVKPGKANAKMVFTINYY